MLEREDFKNRLNNQISIGILEFFYLLMQAYESVEINADIELGGTDQRFNILMGRTLQRDHNQERQVAIFMPLLEGIDGKEKMSKSLGNYIGIFEDKNEIYDKVMQIPDALIVKYFELATDIHPDEIDRIKELLINESINPRDIKMRLAREIVTLYHSEEDAISVKDHFRTVFQRNEMPDDIDNFIIEQNTNIISVITAVGFASSNSEANVLCFREG
jgi:tyrosyl-tRNA synthetase